MTRSRLQRFARRSAAALLILLAVKAGWVLAFRTDGRALLDGSARRDLMARRAYLVDRLARGGGDGALAPGGQFGGEWQLVTLADSALAVAQIAFAYPDTREDAAVVIAALIQRALRRNVRSFDAVRWGEDPIESLAGPNGHIGYLGHLGMMLGAWRAVGGDARYDALHDAVAGARRMDAAPSPFLETYPGEDYTADNAVAMAAVALHGLVSGRDPGHGPLADRWVAHARARLLDRSTGLLVSGVAPDGGPRGSARGSWAGWNAYYLPFIHPGFAAEQEARLDAHLVRRLPFGAAAVREFPPGAAGGGDVDSGPVILGLSPAGTGFAVAGARHARDAALLGALLTTAEVVGCTVQWRGRRRYLLAPLVGDAILVAMKTACPWDRRYIRR